MGYLSPDLNQRRSDYYPPFDDKTVQGARRFLRE
jgi:hypothetical protein